MVQPISNVAQTQPVAEPTKTSTQKSAQPAHQASVDSVNLSDTAQALAATFKEAKETPVQTAVVK
jgi:hypothetical protein